MMDSSDRSGGSQQSGGGPSDLHRSLISRGYLSVRGLVEYLKHYEPSRAVSHVTMKKMLLTGKIRGQKVNGRYRISLEEIERYIEFGDYVPSVKTSPQEGEVRISMDTLLRQGSRYK
jgi:hypothetical protein